MAIEIQNLSWVETADIIPFRFTLELGGLRDQGNLNVWRNLHSPTMHAMDNVSWSTEPWAPPTSSRWVTKPIDYDTSKSDRPWIIITCCVKSSHEQNGNEISECWKHGHICLYTTLEGPWLHKIQCHFCTVQPLYEFRRPLQFHAHGPWTYCEVPLKAVSWHLGNNHQCLLQCTSWHECAAAICHVRMTLLSTKQWKSMETSCKWIYRILTLVPIYGTHARSNQKRDGAPKFDTTGYRCVHIPNFMWSISIPRHWSM